MIKAGWDKMLGNVDRDSHVKTIETPAKEIAAGVASELRAELGLIHNDADNQPIAGRDQSQRLEQILKSLEQTLAAQLSAQTMSDRPSQTLDRIFAKVGAMSPTAQDLLRSISRYHLSLSEYRALVKSPLKDALSELRASGVPSASQTSNR